MSDSKNDENTGSVTDIDIVEGAAGPSPKSFSTLVELLGPESSVPTGGPSLALLRLSRPEIAPELIKLVGLNDVPSNRTVRGRNIPVVLGPFPLETIRTWARDGQLSLADAIYCSKDRWKPYPAIFPELAADDDLVETTGTITLTATSEMPLSSHAEQDQKKSGIELEDDGDSRVDPAAPSRPSMDNSVIDVSPISHTPRTVQDVAESRTSEISRSNRPSAQKPLPTREDISRQTKANPWKNYVVVGVVVAVLGFVATKPFSRKKSAFDGLSTSTPTSNGEVESRVSSNRDTSSWPNSLKPLETDTLNSGDSQMMRRLRPLMTAYENGARTLSHDDEILLKSMADPASSNPDARRVSANLLAAYMMASGQAANAKRFLLPVLQFAPTDPVTLLNVALLHLATEDVREAREVAGSAERLAPASLKWVVSCVLAMVEAGNGQFESAEKYVREAASRSPNNPFVQGLWVTFLLRMEPGKQKQVGDFVRQALWMDPSRLVDSPIRAPLASQAIVSQALEGLKRGVAHSSSRLTGGEEAFVMWLESRFRNLGATDGRNRAMDMLSGESGLQSQMLYAYLLREKGDLAKASEIVNQLLPSIGPEVPSSVSWPWAFAGDLQLARGNTRQAVVFYQQALARNVQDIAAVYGMALAFRDSGDFMSAEQKIAETLSLDPNFIPGILRISRFEWDLRSRHD